MDSEKLIKPAHLPIGKFFLLLRPSGTMCIRDCNILLDQYLDIENAGNGAGARPHNFAY